MLSFREINQKRKKNYQESYLFDLTRLWSLPFTYLFYHTPLTPNMISMLSFVVLLVACGFIVVTTPIATMIGGILCWFSWVFDCVDGEIARLKGLSSDFGAWFDGALDRLGDIVLFGAITINLYQHSASLIVVIVGLLATVSTTLWRLNALYTKTTLHLPLTEKEPLKRFGFDTAAMYVIISLGLIFSTIGFKAAIAGWHINITALFAVMLFFAVIINVVTLKNIITTYVRHARQ
ncbi:MAG: CDP-alcohol phosphatidyltransferase family protein [Candidatus Woesearchaeota archaeon]|nr:CDP-alcohol phosphatidyltransferase family protein [Candidatus Woesearchaeota archaeon]